MIRTPAGTRARVAAVAGDGERPADVLRMAIEREIKRRGRWL